MSSYPITGAMLDVYDTRYSIIDNIKIDGSSDGTDGWHTNNPKGIEVSAGVYSLTINNVDIYDHQYGIQNDGVDTVIISNANIYDNLFGIYFGIHINNGRLETTKIYRNTTGLTMDAAHDAFITSTQIYSNSGAGIAIQ